MKASALTSPAHPWRLLLVLTGLATDGGAEVQATELALRLKRRGWDVSIVCLLPPRAVPAALTLAGIPVESVEMGSGVSATAGLVRLISILKRRRPHIVHSHMTHAVLASRLARLCVNVPVMIGTLHGLHMYNTSGSGHQFREMLHRVSDGLSDLTTVVCEPALRYYGETHAAPAHKLRLIVNGVDCDRFKPDPALRAAKRAELGLSREFTWLVVARLNPVKDHSTLLKAFALATEGGSDSVLLVAGNGELGEGLEAQARALGVAARVRFLGKRNDVVELYQAGDACVLSSRFEALPLTLLEAGASGLPSVATDAGGCSSVIHQGKTGYLVPIADVVALGEAMLRLERLPEIERLSMGLTARDHVIAGYGMEPVVDQWEEVYTSQMKAKGITT